MLAVKMDQTVETQRQKNEKGFNQALLIVSL